MAFALALALLEDKVTYDLYTDVCHNGLGVVLMQRGRVIAYALRQLKDFKTRYSIDDLKLVAIALALKI